MIPQDEWDSALSFEALSMQPALPRPLTYHHKLVLSQIRTGDYY